MSLRRLRLSALLAFSTIGLGACAYDDYGYGYGGASVGYGGYCDPYYDDCYYGGGYYGDPWYGWYGGYYYPGWGIYVYDQRRRPHRWNDHHRRFWMDRRGRWGDRDWNDRRWERWDGWDRDGRDRRWRGDRDGNWRGDGDRRGRGDGRRWRDRRGADAGGQSGAGVRVQTTPRSGEEAVSRESNRDWSGRASGRSSGRAWQGRASERDPD